MSSTILIKHSSASGVTPSSLGHGELAINTGDGKLFYGNISGTPVQFSGGGGTTPTSSLLTTASAAGNTITFTKGDGSTFPVTVSGGSGTPGGSNTQIQFNGNGVFSGSSALTFNSGSNTLTLTGSLNITGSTTQIGNQTITGSILMSGSSFISGVDYIDFDTTASNAGAIARLKWNDTDGTLDLGLKGGNVTLQIGQEQLVRVVNKTATNITLLEANYQAVRLTGAQGQRLKVDLAQATSDGLSAETLGLVTETIANNQEGFVTTSGLVRGINTTGTLQGETWSDGDVLYLSPTTAGNITNIKPVAPNHLIVIGYVIHAHNTQGTIFVKVDNGYEIDELHNVLINTGSLTSGQLLVRSGSVWINSTQLTGSYGLTGSLTVTQNISASSFTGSLLGTASFATTASYAMNAGASIDTSSFATTGSNTFNGTQTITGSGQLLVKSSTTNGYLQQTNDFVGTSTGTNVFIGLAASTGNTYAILSTRTSGGIGGGNLAMLSSGGNVAIGKTTFNAVLDVNGNTIVTGSLNVTAGITGSFSGNGSGLTGVGGVIQLYRYHQHLIMPLKHQET